MQEDQGTTIIYHTMIYKQKVTVPSQNKVIEHVVAQCLKCGSDDIDIREYEDNFGYISTAKCNSCQNEVKVNACEVDVINEWNNQNDIPTLIANKLNLISTTKEEIAKLSHKQKEKEKVIRKKARFSKGKIYK